MFDDAGSYDADSDIFLEEAYLLNYQNGQIVDEEKLSAIEENRSPDIPIEFPAGFHRTSSEEKTEYTSLVLKAVYSNGISFEKEIYSKK